MNVIILNIFLQAENFPVPTREMVKSVPDLLYWVVLALLFVTAYSHWDFKKSNKKVNELYDMRFDDSKEYREIMQAVIERNTIAFSELKSSLEGNNKILIEVQKSITEQCHASDKLTEVVRLFYKK